MNYCFGITYVAMFAIVGVCYIKIAILLRQSNRVMISWRLSVFKEARPANYSNKVYPLSVDGQNQPTTSTIKVSVKTIETVSEHISHNTTNIRKSPPQRNEQPHGLVSKSSVSVNNWVGNLLPATTMSTMVSGDNAASHVDQNHNNHKRTTLVMFLITMVFIMSWTIFWVVKATATNDAELGRVVLHLARTLYLINCVTNPVFYMSLSSKFRKTTVNVFHNMCKPCVRLWLAFFRLNGKVLRKHIACIGKKQPRIYWSSSSIIMKDATP